MGQQQTRLYKRKNGCYAFCRRYPKDLLEHSAPAKERWISTREKDKELAAREVRRWSVKFDAEMNRKRAELV